MDINFFWFVLVGFLAQIIDGSLGMAYGVSANSFLMAIGLNPAASSATVHAAEVVTSLFSGLSHWKMGNLDKRLILFLLIPGVIGGAIGAYILTSFEGDTLKPYIAIYLLLMGVRILIKAFRKQPPPETEPKTALLLPLGLFGGACDAIGGGGWGPVVTSTLLSSGNAPRKVIGSVNISEFFVTVAESIVFILTIGLTGWREIVGLILGGALAAPLGALVVKKLPTRLILILVGVLIVFLQLRTLYLIWF